MTSVATNQGSSSQPTARSLAMNRLFRHTVTSSDRAAVSQYLLDAEREMKGYDVEINRMKAGILSLENKKSALREKMDKYRSLLAPVHRLPPEILTNIMSISCKSCEIKELETTPPIILSSVCGRWRDIVVSTSSLWSFLSLKFLRWKATDRNLEAARKLHKLTLFFLSRSQTAPLSLILDFSDAETELVDAIPTLGTLVAHSNRWYDVSLISFTPAILQQPIIQRLAGRLPLLHRLCITAFNEEGDEPLSASALFSDCPNLHSLDITPAYPCTRQVLPFHQIRSLTLRMCFAPIAFDYLSQCRNVRRLELNTVGGLNDEVDYLVSNAIKYLSIFADNQEDLDCVFLNTTLPDLSSLNISGKDDKDDKPDEPWTKLDERPICDFVQRSACSITSLHLRWLPLTDTQTITLLRLLPELSTLCIEEQLQIHSYRRTNKIVTSAFAKQLTVDLVDTPSTPFLPRLKDLTLVVHHRGLDQQGLSNAITSRWLPEPDPSRTIVCLRSVTVTVLGCTYISGPFDSLQCFRDAGLRMSISTRYE